jgi:hypothetical protein
MELRRKSEGEDAPVTTRQLESLVRLAQARAKMEMRELVTSEDAQDVVILMRSTLYDICCDADGNMMSHLNPGAEGVSDNVSMKRLHGELKSRARQQGNLLFPQAEVIRAAKDIGVYNAVMQNNDSFSTFLEYMNDQMLILKRGNRVWKVAGVDGMATGSQSQHRQFQRKSSYSQFGRTGGHIGTRKGHRRSPGGKNHGCIGGSCATTQKRLTESPGWNLRKD